MKASSGPVANAPFEACRWFLRAAWVCLATSFAGCQPAAPHTATCRFVVHATATAPAPCLSAIRYVSSVKAMCPPPLDWQPEPLRQNARHTHQVWVSPSGKTAYGVIHFSLPLPVGADLALGGFLTAMRKSEGQAILIEKHYEDNLPGIRFIADGGRYRIRARLIVHGWEAWTIYAGTLRGQAAVDDELALAEGAAKYTRTGSDQPAR